jgi:hypothetical protein
VSKTHPLASASSRLCASGVLPSPPSPAASARRCKPLHSWALPWLPSRTSSGLFSSSFPLLNDSPLVSHACFLFALPPTHLFLLVSVPASLLSFSHCVQYLAFLKVVLRHQLSALLYGHPFYLYLLPRCFYFSPSCSQLYL